MPKIRVKTYFLKQGNSEKKVGNNQKTFELQPIYNKKVAKSNSKCILLLNKQSQILKIF